MIYDLIIIGAGPAGLSAAINGASELNKVLLIDSGKKISPGQYKRQLGGQAVGSSAIENYPGFQKATGRSLMRQFEKQAERLGTEIRCPEHADGLSLEDGGIKSVTTAEGGEYFAKAVILANGLSYRKLEAPGVIELLGKGVQYGAPTFNPMRLGKCNICVVGGANSAGQAVMHLSQNTDAQIKMLIRGTKTIDDQMSKYLVDRIRGCSNIEVMQGYSVVEAHGNDNLESLVVEDNAKGRTEMVASQLYIFIGAQPKVSWLPPEIVRDPNGFIGTGMDVGSPLAPRMEYETSMSGVFAAGDVRRGSVKRISAGVGEGSGAISSVHRYLSTFNHA